jgi:hypothetical protein
MSDERRTVWVHIVMTESGAYVVADDADVAAELAEDEFPDDDVRQVALKIELLPPSLAPEPKTVPFRED